MASRIIGTIAGLSSLLLWFSFHFMNPYNDLIGIEPFFRTTLLLALPACLAIYAAWRRKKVPMLIAFIWSFPLSLYTGLTQSMYSFFGITCLFYLTSYFLMLLSERTNK
ncbi:MULTISPECIES: hypothetical protein [Gracilibacillus]|uniref:Uncharacterized protein n=1 Tax=Gracilibacillus dipsosauri TaxID=178340 RepID=A0A317L379_9BACI|nr:hypothetical protein [Gracilibacillus dipsosauri]PWU68249.1 hypothetical protein DLJ74_07270 [Gracilibacillus dipsosauri]